MRFISYASSSCWHLFELYSTLRIMSYQPPDLASVLRTLAQYAPPQPDISVQAPIQHSVPTTSIKTLFNGIDEEDYEPPEASKSDTHPATLKDRGHGLQSQADLAIKPVPPQIDPSTITDWPNGLRHVMKAVARNDAIIHRLQKVWGV